MAPHVEGEERVMKPRSAAHEKQGWMVLSREGSWKAFSVRCFLHSLQRSWRS